MKIPKHIKSSAEFSDDTDGSDGRGEYRYTLWRKGLLDDDPGAYAQFYDKYAQFICLNPSTASEHEDDPTVKRCWQRARRMGYGAFVMTNLFAYRATDPKRMKLAEEPIGEWNDEWLSNLAFEAGLIILAWGCDGRYLERDKEVLRLLEPHIDKMMCLKLTQDGYPCHPLYLPDKLKPIHARGMNLWAELNL